MPDQIRPVANADSVLVSRETFNRMAEVLNWISKLTVVPPLMLGDGRAGPVISLSPGGDTVVIAKITARAAGHGTYDARTLSGDVTDRDPADDLAIPETGETVATADDLLVEYLPDNGSGGWSLQVGDFVLGIPWGSTDEDPPRTLVRAVWGPRLTLVPVHLASDGGDGTTTNFTYTVTDAITGSAIGTTMSPTWVRVPRPMVAATHGTGYYTSPSTFVLYQADERVDGHTGDVTRWKNVYLDGDTLKQNYCVETYAQGWLTSIGSDGIQDITTGEDCGGG